jgi:prepilin-type processing-associated H-X9-DG protein
LGLATQLHLESNHGRFPTGGWGPGWTGDPDQPNDRRQPGGWVYNLLPYLEQASLHAMGAGQPESVKKVLAGQSIATPLAVFHCPSRRAAKTYPNLRPYEAFNAILPGAVARSDYAINAGDRGGNGWDEDVPQPRTVEDGRRYPWPPTLDFTGISFLRSEVRVSHVEDGTASTYLIGEKYLNPEHYHSGFDRSDRGHMYLGFSVDNYREAGNLDLVRLNPGANVLPPPRRDTWGAFDDRSFGSAHGDGCHFVFCDGSVRRVSYTIDAVIHSRLANRKDGSSAVSL